MTDGVGSENYSFDILGNMTQLQKVINGTTYTTSYQYNLAGELTQITYPSGRVVQQSYDNIGRLCAVGNSGSSCSSGTTFASGFAYNAAFQVTGFNYGNGVAATFGYTPDRLLLQSFAYTKGATTLFSTNYWYKTDSTNCPAGASGNNGQIQCITDNVDSGRTASYSYDALYRLTNATTSGSTNYPKWGLSMSYDRYGNRTAQSISSGCTGITCPTNSVSVDATTNRINTPGYAYDANGNMTNDGANTLVYDAENRVLSATNGGSSGTYTYDGNNLRVKKVSGSTTTVYIFSGSQVIAEYDNGAAPSAPTREYIYSGAALLAKIDSNGTKYFHQDHLSNRVATDSSGNSAEQLGHFPFGESWYNSSSDKLLFTSYERDSESGNDYAMMRSYINRLARFSSPDPLSGSASAPQSLNKYEYAGNDPVDLEDPSGLHPIFNVPPPPPPGGWDSWFFDLFILGGDSNSGLDINPTTIDVNGDPVEVDDPGAIFDLWFPGDPGNFFGGSLDVSGLRGNALVALLNPDCSSLFGGFANAVSSLFKSSYNRYVPGQGNPFPDQISAKGWNKLAQNFSNTHIAGQTFRYPNTPGGIIFFSGTFNLLDPGFAIAPDQQTQMTVFFHEQEHAANHAGGEIDVNYSADYKKINERCKLPQVEQQSSPITGELTPP